MFTNVYSPIILCYILIFLCIADSQISNNHLLFGTLMHSAIVQASVWYLNVLHIQRRSVFMEEKHDRSKNGNLLPNYMATLQVQQRNLPPVITYINILITSECTANGRWLNTKGVIRHPRWILFARYQRTKPGEQLMLQVGSFPQVTRQTSGTAQGRATHTGCVSSSTDMQRSWRTLTLIASVMYRSDKTIHQSSRKMIKTLLNN